MGVDETYLTPDELAVMFRVTGATIRRLIRSGEIPAVRIGSQWRVPRSGIGEVTQSKQANDHASA